jgi:UDP-N-acetylglucosamine acyltransferase
VVEHGARLGQNNFIGPFTYVGPNVKIGDNNYIQGHASIGTPAEHAAHFFHDGPVEIGSHNVIREFVTINAPTVAESVTRMGNNCIMLRGSHLSHDSLLEDHVTVSCSVLIGGHTHIMRYANLGLGAIIHQHQLIGTACMLGMGAVVTRTVDVVPGGIWVGNPAKFIKQNSVGIYRSGLGTEQMAFEIERFRTLRRR